MRPIYVHAVDYTIDGRQCRMHFAATHVYTLAECQTFLDAFDGGPIATQVEVCEHVPNDVPTSRGNHEHDQQ